MQYIYSYKYYNIKCNIKISAIILALCFSILLSIYPPKALCNQTPNQSETNKHYTKDNTLKKDVLCLALKATLQARKKGIGSKPILTIIDYSLPSSQKRLWVINLNSKKILFNTYVAHGINSGNDNATAFSNQPRSHKSSLGMYVTGKMRPGKHGKSLELYGLEKNINHNAFRRKIVFHPASYVNDSFIKLKGRLGRSHGCFALNKKIAIPLMTAIANGSYVYTYHPNLLKK